MMISWDDLGRPTVPGDYGHKSELVRVDADAVSVWQSEPTALFHVITHAAHVGVGVFLLGAYEVPEGPEPRS